MITQERIKKLLKQGATIYDIFKGDIYLVDLTMAKYYDVPKYIEYKNDYYTCNLTRHIEDLFETKEEAEWQLEFGNITRTETLKLPTWEEFEPKGCFFFKAKDGRDIVIEEILTIDFSNEDELSVTGLKMTDLNDYEHKPLFRGDYTKENYTKACRLAKKLFLGEEI